MPMFSNRSRRNQLWLSTLAGAIVAAWTASGSAQSALALSSLTVPDKNLPDGCTLKPYVPPASDPFPANPWSGADRKLVAAVHLAIEAHTGGRPLPDVPLEAPPPPNAAASQRKWADSILEAYHAAYASADYRQVDVFAVTFNDVKLAATPESLSAMLNPPRGATRRVVRGATVVRVSAPVENECFRAVQAHVESLK